LAKDPERERVMPARSFKVRTIPEVKAEVSGK
jgi:hypothetical protein